MRNCGTRKWPVINPAEITVKIEVSCIFSSFFLLLLIVNCSNITAKKISFWRRKAGLKDSRTHKGDNAKWSLSKLAPKLLSLVLKVTTEEMRLVPSFLFQVINWCAINMLLKPLVLTITILHFWSNFFFISDFSSSLASFLSVDFPRIQLRMVLETIWKTQGVQVAGLWKNWKWLEIQHESSLNHQKVITQFVVLEGLGITFAANANRQIWVPISQNRIEIRVM